MIIYLPKRFDLNEWFLILSVMVNIVFALPLPKRFSPALTTLILLLNLYLGQVCDILIGILPYDLYDENDSPKYEIFDAVLHFFSYPPVMYMMLHFYDRWNLKGILLILYIGGFALLIVGLEWLAVLAHVFKYKSWHLSYSFFVYTGVITLNILFFHLSQYLLRRKKSSEDLS
ncbi:hypothetical protein [Bacillus sp. ISL-77]|uniref:hypothetical protein n=1 Tax=Bacillus sp. ISL-77 TaxID=2819138 RepID=UPI001BE580F1|nr:hypothetical protein [Bacillus sp. ISL-77]MBT2740726.1 hypothetical protein [Bacillus sp. ISL-77]